MSEFDLGAERAKRAPESKTLIMRGDDGEVLVKYDMVPEWPVEAFDLGAAGKLGAAFREIFVDPEEADEFMTKYKPSMDDFVSVMEHAYGLRAPGEPSASGG